MIWVNTGTYICSEGPCRARHSCERICWPACRHAAAARLSQLLQPHRATCFSCSEYWARWLCSSTRRASAPCRPPSLEAGRTDTSSSLSSETPVCLVLPYFHIRLSFLTGKPCNFSLLIPDSKAATIYKTLSQFSQLRNFNAIAKALEKANANPLQYSCLENPREEPW